MLPFTFRSTLHTVVCVLISPGNNLFYIISDIGTKLPHWHFCSLEFYSSKAVFWKLTYLLTLLLLVNFAHLIMGETNCSVVEMRRLSSQMFSLESLMLETVIACGMIKLPFACVLQLLYVIW